MGTTLMDGPDGIGGPRPQGTTLMGPTGGGTRLVSVPGEEPSKAGFDPVVGWLVILDGPGRGASVKIGYGMNIVGRGHGNRIVLNFGDDQISERDHFRIAYDAEQREFHLVPGTGTNLLYERGRAVLGPQPLANGTDIRLGGTTLRFVALCGKEWDWGGQEKAG